MFTAIENWQFVLVSADYRLAPQVGIKEMFDDVQDCIDFIRDPSGMARFLPEGIFDSQRLAVCGSGGGGYLALLAGLHIYPTPLAVLALHPITDPLGSHFITTHPWDEEDRNGMDTKTAEAAMKPYLDPRGEVVTDWGPDGDDPPRGLLFKYALYRGNLAELLHFDTTTNAQLDPANDKWRVPKQIAACGMPPTFILHGEADKQVDVGQSDELVGALRRVFGHDTFTCIVSYESPLGEGHAFDEGEDTDNESEGEDDGLQAIPYERIVRYMNVMYNFMHSFV